MQTRCDLDRARATIRSLNAYARHLATSPAIWLSFKAKLILVTYQWRLGGPLGDRMARWMSELARAPAPPQDIGANMGYPYAMQWFGVKGGFGALRPLDPRVPMFFFYGERKPFMFHSTAWREKLAAQPASE